MLKLFFLVICPVSLLIFNNKIFFRFPQIKNENFVKKMFSRLYFLFILNLKKKLSNFCFYRNWLTTKRFQIPMKTADGKFDFYFVSTRTSFSWFRENLFGKLRKLSEKERKSFSEDFLFCRISSFRQHCHILQALWLSWWINLGDIVETDNLMSFRRIFFKGIQAIFFEVKFHFENCQSRI